MPAADGANPTIQNPGTGVQEEWIIGEQKRGREKRDSIPMAPQPGRNSCSDSLRLSNHPTPNLSNSADCSLGPWSAWGPCNPACGSGVQASFRLVTDMTPNATANCPGVSRHASCHQAPCGKTLASISQSIFLKFITIYFQTISSIWTNK